ncbi:MAG: intraciliary transport, partial [Paramarteilia canceri]
MYISNLFSKQALRELENKLQAINELDYHRLKAMTFYEKNDLSEAKNIIQKYLKEKCIKSNINLGCILFREKNIKQSLQIFKRIGHNICKNFLPSYYHYCQYNIDYIEFMYQKQLDTTFTYQCVDKEPDQNILIPTELCDCKLEDHPCIKCITSLRVEKLNLQAKIALQSSEKEARAVLSSLPKRAEQNIDTVTFSNLSSLGMSGEFSYIDFDLIELNLLSKEDAMDRINFLLKSGQAPIETLFNSLCLNFELR